MSEEIDKFFILENQLSKIRLDNTKFEIFIQKSVDGFNKLQTQIDSLNNKLLSMEAKIREIEARGK